MAQHKGVGRIWDMEDSVSRESVGTKINSVGPRSISVTISNQIPVDSASQVGLPLMPKQKCCTENISVKS